MKKVINDYEYGYINHGVASIKDDEKVFIKKQICRKISYSEPVKVKDITVELLPDDIISAGYDEGFMEENNGMYPHYYLTVDRLVEETEEQKRLRLAKAKKFKTDLKERRYQTYLQLKKEFEDDRGNKK